MLENWLYATEIDHTAYPEATIGQEVITLKTVEQSQQKPRVVLIDLDGTAQAIKAQLFQYRHPFPPKMLGDFGQLRTADVSFAIPLLKELISSDFFPILLAADPQWQQVQLQAHRQLAQKAVNSTTICDRLTKPRQQNGQHYYIGTQVHLSDKELLQEQNIGLGKSKRSLSEVEPAIRTADTLVFELAALKYTDFNAQQPFSPSGFSLEEACQLTYYAGMSDQLRSIGFFGYDATALNAVHAATIAQLIWYNLDGFFNRKMDYPISVNNLVEYVVHLKSYDQSITFWKSQKSSRWWLEVKGQKHNQLLPCSYEDYRSASAGNLTERLLYYLQ